MPVAKRAPRPRPLTERQRAIHVFMLEYQKEHGMPPTLREIGDHFEISSTNGVQDHMRAMREVQRRWSPVGLIWPFAIAFGALVVLGWCIAWIGRGPARLAVRHERKRRQAERLARAEVHHAR